MRRLILCLTVALVALIALIGVPKAVEGLVQFGFFALLVVFVVLMVRHLAEDR